MNSNKHAYCIIAHGDPYCLQTLINLIDDKRNDIYILYDKKSDKSQFIGIKAQVSPIYFPTKEIEISWGHYSQIFAELLLFEAVLKHKDTYKYIHLLSGTDLPLHNQDYIHDYFNNLPTGTNLIGYANDEKTKVDLKYKTQFQHILTKHYRSKNSIFRRSCSVIRNIWIGLQKIFNIKIDWSGYDLAKGANWVSLTPEFANYLVANKEMILKKFKYVSCADEIYKQTLASTSEFRNTILTKNDEFKGCMRKIDWGRGNPYVWHNDDLDELLNSDMLFARKFQSDVDREIIDRVFMEVSRNNQRK